MAHDGHPFDQAIALVAQGPDRWRGHTRAAYWNMVGPFGGITAATVLQAVLRHPQCLGVPVALTVNYAAALVAGPFTVTARAARTNRSTQHWVVEVTQEAPGADGRADTGVVLTATVLTALRRDTWGIQDTPMPAVPMPQDVVSPPPWHAPIEWIKRYEVLQLQGPLPGEWDGAVSTLGPDEASLSRLWMRDAPPRPLDYASLAALADVFFPRVYLRRARRVPAGTVSMTVYFHADDALLREVGDGYVLGQARAHAFHAGFHDQSAQLWSACGKLLATSLQMVYYKE